MIQVNEIAFTAYPVADKQRARDFYEGVLNLKQTSGGDLSEGFWLEYDLGPNTLALVSYWKPNADTSKQTGPTVGLEVENYEETVATLKAKNVPFLMETLETPVCFMSVVTDPDGNSLFIHKRKPGRS
jgi:catechol 2,3-dioxygenase-like lactoylglutathione lyase family enzyme